MPSLSEEVAEVVGGTRSGRHSFTFADLQQCQKIPLLLVRDMAVNYVVCIIFYFRFQFRFGLLDGPWLRSMPALYK